MTVESPNSILEDRMAFPPQQLTTHKGPLGALAGEDHDDSRSQTGLPSGGHVAGAALRHDGEGPVGQVLPPICERI